MLSGHDPLPAFSVGFIPRMSSRSAAPRASMNDDPSGHLDDAPVPAPAAGEPADLGTDAPTSPKPSFSRTVTALWTAALLAIGGCMLYGVAHSRDQLLERPAPYLDRVLGRDLDAAEYTPFRSPWQTALNAWDTSNPSQALTDAIDTYQDFQRRGILTDHARATRTLAVLLAEAGRLPEVERMLQDLSHDPTEDLFRGALRVAYQMPAPDRALLLQTNPVSQDLNPRWARDKLDWRLAKARGQTAAARQIEQRLQSRGRTLQNRISALSLVNFLLTGSGLAMLVVWWRRRTDLILAEGARLSPWTLAEGYALLVRAAAMGMVLALGTAFLSESVPVVSGCATLLSALPLFWLARRHQLFPPATPWPDQFGLRLPEGKWRFLAGLSLVAIALMISGEFILGFVSDRIESGSLAESIPEDFLFENAWTVLFSVVDAVIWAPLVEEIAFRGFLYTSLRRRFPMLGAAALSSVIFALVHGYSLPGFLTICWSGFLWALLYEKTRSLWPGILCHAMSNLLATLGPILIYRW
jgi:uncharacterized protein